MNKFQRNYKLIYTIGNGEKLTLSYPLKIEFSITRDAYAGSNNTNIKIYNVSKTHRHMMFQDYMNLTKDNKVALYAGYGSNTSKIFDGKVMRAYPRKIGQDVVMEIEGYDFGIFDSTSSITFDENTTKRDAIQTLIQDMPGVQLGDMAGLDEPLEEKIVVCGNTFDSINRIAGGGAFIDNGKLCVLKNNEVRGTVRKINATTGLLNTPRKQDAYVELDLVFAPEIIVGQLVDIQSITGSEFNGQFKVVGLKHQGTISGADCGSVQTTLILKVAPILSYGQSSKSVVQINGKETKKVKLDGIESAYVFQVYYDQVVKLDKSWLKSHKVAGGQISWWDCLHWTYDATGEIPPLQVMYNMYYLISTFEKFIKDYCGGAKITVNCVWRSTSHNAQIKGASSTSDHIKGKAIDFKLSGTANYKEKFQKYWKYGQVLIYDWGMHAATTYSNIQGDF